MTPQDPGGKYLKRINSALVQKQFIYTDVYAVLEAFGVTCPARQHAIKKLLCAGKRNKGSEMQDLKESLASVQRAIEMLEANE